MSTPSARPLNSIDLVEAALSLHGEGDIESTFGHHAWIAAWFVPSSEMPAFAALVDRMLTSRGDAASPAVSVDASEFSIPPDSLDLFNYHCSRMFWSV